MTTTKWGVFHQLVAGGRRHSRLRLVVEDVPADVNKRKVTAALLGAGHAARFSEGGVLWANHALMVEAKWPEAIEANGERVEVVSWADLLDPTGSRRLTVDYDPQPYATLQMAAAHAGQPLATWARQVLDQAAAVELAEVPA